MEVPRGATTTTIHYPLYTIHYTDRPDRDGDGDGDGPTGHIHRTPAARTSHLRPPAACYLLSAIGNMSYIVYTIHRPWACWC
jgi:hypothetical protein